MNTPKKSIHHSGNFSYFLQLHATAGTVDGERINGKATDSITMLVTLRTRDTVHLQASGQCASGQCELTVNTRFTGTLISLAAS